MKEKFSASLIPVESIQERDVDLLLLEELSVNPSFCNWLVTNIGLPTIENFIGAWHSISDFGLGETDLLLSYISGDKRIYALIENKIDAEFQDEQYKRYTARAEKYVKEDSCDHAEVILVAPKLYCENQNNFETFVTYEEVSEQLLLSNTKRSLFKSQLLNIASEKLRRGYQPINSEPVQRFWIEYWKYVVEKYPEFKMKKPGIVPHGSDWPRLFDYSFQNIVFVHKLAQGNVDATISGSSEGIEYMLREELPEWASFKKHRHSFSIRVFSGEVDRTKKFDDQRDIVDKGLQNLVKIRKWLVEKLTGYNNVQTP